jgi:hypothetical protein
MSTSPVICPVCCAVQLIMQQCRDHFMVGLDLDVPRSEVVFGVFE